jgi:hypothetical protein
MRFSSDCHRGVVGKFVEVKLLCTFRKTFIVARRWTMSLKFYFISHEPRSRPMRGCQNIHAVLQILLRWSFLLLLNGNQVLISFTEMLPSALCSLVLCAWRSTVSSASARNFHFLHEMFLGSRCYLTDNTVYFSPCRRNGEPAITMLENMANWTWLTQSLAVPSDFHSVDSSTETENEQI